MKKLIVVVMALCALAACHSDPQTSTPTLSLGLGTFGQLKIVYSAAVAPEWVGQEIVVNQTPELIRVVKRGTAAGGEEKMCMGAVPLKEEEYSAILDLIAEAHLEGYTPAEDCEMLVGATGISITYQLTGGEMNAFKVMCEPEPEIAALIDEVDRIADASIPDCNTDQYMDRVEPTPDEEIEPVQEPTPEQESGPVEEYEPAHEEQV